MLIRLESGVVRYETVLVMKGRDSAAAMSRSSRRRPAPLSIGSGAWSVTTKNAAMGSAKDSRMSASARDASEPLMGSPSTCFQFALGSDGLPTAAPGRPAYRRIGLRADGVIETEICWLDGADPSVV